MTKSKKFKRRVRAHAAKTGMGYAASRRVLDSAPSSEDWRSKRLVYGQEFRDQCFAYWHALIEELTPNGENRVVWTSVSDIVAVLQRVADNARANHMYLPTGGGLDLEGAQRNVVEPGCIDLIFSSHVQLLRPVRLALEVNRRDHDWSYLWLMSLPLSPSGAYEYSEASLREELCEVAPGEYRELNIWVEGALGYDEYGDEIPLPSSARRVVRWLGECRFLLVCKASTYNDIPATYDGRHARVSDEEFRQVMALGAAGDLSWFRAR